MLESLTIRNFQCHEKTTLEFDEYVTTIVGSSDVGKSASLRALLWVCTNLPSGFGFLRSGSSGKASSNLKLDGRSVLRLRGEVKNKYTLDGKVFTALRTSVPDEIQNLINIKPEINFQRQQEPPFWFSKTPGEVSRELNQIINLGLMDQTMSNLSSRLRQARAIASVTEDRLSKARLERERLSWVKDLHEDLIQLRHEISSVEEMRQDCVRMSGLIEDAERLDEIRSDALRIATDAEKTIDVWSAVVSLREEIATLKTLVQTLEESEEIIRTRIPDEDVSVLEEYLTSIQNQQREVAKIQTYLRELQAAEDYAWEANQSALRCEAKLKKLIGKECPLCGQKVATS